ncbi:MAG: clan AA aspartic protease [Planctomycetes bacterium]|nr:clan AA aspartic protease [Planctomycetota bacterium]
MITGRVTQRYEAAIPVVLRGRNQAISRVVCVIDTGFDGCLCLPPEDVAALGLTLKGAQPVVLGDGSEAELLSYEVEVEWHGQLFLVSALRAESVPLVGMAMLRGSKVTMEVVTHGGVRVEPMPEP